MQNKKEKTHWLASPNKNYLGHWDLPNGDDLILTIKSAEWEPVKNPIIQKTEACRVIRFQEDVKPMICNQINAQSILECTGEKFMEDCGGKKIKLYVGKFKDRRTKQTIDCLRVRKCTQDDLQPKLITKTQLETIFEKINKTDKTAENICTACRIKSLEELPQQKFPLIIKRLDRLAKEKLEKETNESI